MLHIRRRMEGVRKREEREEGRGEREGGRGKEAKRNEGRGTKEII